MTTTKKHQVGDKVVCNGYQGTVTALTDYGMVEVRLERGSVCVDPSDVQPGTVWDLMCDCACADMRTARNEGSILITETRRGTVDLTYGGDGVYSIRADGRDIGRASTAKTAVAMLAPLYQVVIEA